MISIVTYTQEKGNKKTRKAPPMAGPPGLQIKCNLLFVCGLNGSIGISSVKRLVLAVAFGKIHTVFIDGLADCSKQLLHADASPFPGPGAQKCGVFYISLSTGPLAGVDGLYIIHRI
jgi:hypothetical protein